jgi:putative peptidoglycan lipid II flippase
MSDQRESELIKESLNFRKSALVLTGFWFLQMAASGVVQIFIASQYGTASSLDIYLAGVTIPTTIFMVFSSGVGITTIIFFNELRVQKGQLVACEQLTSAAVVSGFVGLVIMSALMTQGGFLRYVTPGLTNDQLQAAVSVLRVTSMAIPVLSALTVVQGLLQANHRFGIFSLAALLQVLLLPSFVFLKGPTPQALAWGFNLGAWISFVLVVGAAMRAGLLRFHSISHKHLGRLFVLALPLTLAAFLTHLVWVSERHFASLFGAGGISALSYSQRIVNLLGGALTYGLSTVLLPTVSRRIEEAQFADAGRLNRKVLLVLALPTVIIAIAMILLSRPLVQLLFERGAFTPISTTLTATSLTMYCGLLMSNVIGAVVMKNLFAAKEGWLNVSMSLFMLLAFLLLARPMIAVFGFAGLPLTTSIAFTLGLLLAAVTMAIKHPHLFHVVHPARSSLTH